MFQLQMHTSAAPVSDVSKTSFLADFLEVRVCDLTQTGVRLRLRASERLLSLPAVCVTIKCKAFGHKAWPEDGLNGFLHTNHLAGGAGATLVRYDRYGPGRRDCLRAYVSSFVRGGASAHSPL